jgi:FtsZ-interacting cell division protein ZipA
MRQKIFVVVAAIIVVILLIGAFWKFTGKDQEDNETVM